MGTASPLATRLRHLASAVLCLYAVGLFLAEAVLQAGAVLAVALTLGLVASRRLRLGGGGGRWRWAWSPAAGCGWRPTCGRTWRRVVHCACGSSCRPRWPW